MKKINLKWDADGIIDSYSVYRSETRINSSSSPSPLATGLQRRSYEVMLRSFWFSSKVTGDFKVQFESFKGGTMTKNGYDFINSGGISVQTVTIDCHTDTVSGSNIAGDLVATLTYDSRLSTYTG